MAINDSAVSLTDGNWAATLRAEAEIRKVLYSYCHSIDRCDLDELTAVYHPDAIDDHGDVSNGNVSEYIPKVLEYVREKFSTTTHNLGNIQTNVHGEIADVETHIRATHVCHPDVDGRTMIEFVGARWIDRFERRGGAWKVAHRVSLIEWSHKTEIDPVYELAAEATPGMYRTGIRDGSDPSYLRD